MGKLILTIPEDIHDKLRHMKVDKRKDIKDLIMDSIRHYLKEDEKK